MSWKSVPVKAQKPSYLEIVAGGDVMIGHWTLSYLEKYGADYPFLKIESTLKAADIAFANIEAPFADSGKAVENKRFTFKVPTKYAKSIKNAGFNLVSIANNHIMDFGEPALATTRNILQENAIHFSGAGLSLQDAWEPAIVETDAGKVALLAFAMTFPKEFWANDSTGGTAYPYENKMAATIDSLNSKVDYILVSFHWGTEKKTTPNDYQTYFARLAIDHGADLVLGHHPHVLQGFEIYKNRLIAYSLGNLAFSAYSKAALNSILLKVKLHKDGLFTAGILPLNIDNTVIEFQPDFAKGKQKEFIIQELDSLSRELNGADIMNENGFIYGHLPSTHN